MKKAKKIKVIINSRAVGKKVTQLPALIRKHLPEYIVDCVPTEYAGHAEKIARHISPREYDIIVAVGGDGTINEIINGNTKNGLPLGIIPAGTANDLAVYYGIPSDIKLACDVIKHGQARKADTIRINRRHYITTGGFGFASEVVRYGAKIRNSTYFGNYLSALLGSWFYILMFVIVSIYRYKTFHRCKLTIDNQPYEFPISLAIIGVLPFLGNRFRILPFAGHRQELMDICIIRKHTNYLSFLRTVSKVLSGKHLTDKNVFYDKAKNIKLESFRPSAFFGDGEILETGRSFEANIHPRSIKLLIPKEKVNRSC
jgi:diacylglycerol kinase (ATP)